MLSFELERGLFKLRADGPELEVLLNADPRIGNHRNFVIISQCIFISVFADRTACLFCSKRKGT